MIQGLDTPVSAGSQAEVAHSWLLEGRSFEVRQTFRNKLLALTRQNVIEAVERVIAPNIHLGSAVVFAGRDLLEKANQQLRAEGKDPLMIEAI
jgi:Zn-dependent M16 (insulinase) family peptidase